MKLQVFQFVLLVAIAACPGSGASAQEAPAQEQPAQDRLIAEPSPDFTRLSEIHSGKSIWSEKQCNSCHQGVHGLARESQLLLSRSTVANPLGVEVAVLDGTLRLHLNVDEKSGLVLSSVPEGCEGAKLGLKGHDVLLNVNQQPVKEADAFNRLILDLQGKKAQFALLRQGKPLGLEIAVPKQPVTMDFDLAVQRSLWSDDRYRMGVTLSDADDTLRSHLKLAAGEGLVVTEVVDDSPAAKMGVKQHDVLVELDGKRLTTVDAINAQIQELKDKTVVLKLLRSGQEVTCQIAAKKSSEAARAWKELVLVDEYHHHPAIVRWMNAKPEVTLTSTDAATQLAELKKQLAELGKTVERLEALVGPAAAPADQPKLEPEKK